MHPSHISRFVVIALAAWCCSVLSLSAIASAATKPKPSAHSGSLHGKVPSAQAAIFHVLKRPAVRKMPKRVTRVLARNPVAHQMGVDITQARKLGNTAKTFYLVPGTHGICLVLSDGGSVCTGDLASVATYGLAVDLANPTTNADGTVNPTGDVTALGVAPDGFTSATVTTDSGVTVTGTIANNSYVIHTSEAIATTTFSGPGRDPVTTP